MGNTTRAVSARRYDFTPELLADGRHRYEHTDETITSIAFDFGVHKSTLTRLATREGWVRYVRPPRDLPQAKKIRISVEALAQGQGAGTKPQTSLEEIPTRLASTESRLGDLPFSKGGEEREAAAEEEQLPSPAELVRHLYREAFEQFRALRAMREQFAYQTQSQRDIDKITRSLATLTDTLRKLLPMQSANSQSETAYDDMPLDIDEFRNELARRIRAFVASRSGRGDAGGDAG